MKMDSSISYTDSHKKEEKGISYDKHYAEDSWRRFLWSRERVALTAFLETYLRDWEINLLDFACGTGRICGFLENRVTTAVGVDVSKSMLDAAKQRLTRTELIQADITKGDVLQGRKFNLITAFRFFLNAGPELRRKVLKALVPLLEEDGYFVFNNHRNRTSPLVRFKYNRCHKQRNFMSMQEMHSLVSEFGLEIARIYPIGFLPLPKVKLPELCNRAIDSIAAKFKCLRDFSESPIAVCQHSSQIEKKKIKCRENARQI